MHKQSNNTSKTTRESALCYPTKAKDGGRPNYLVKVIGRDGHFCRIFWMSRNGKFLNPAKPLIWDEWPKSCTPQPVMQDVPEHLVPQAIRIFGQIGEAIKKGFNVSDYIKAEDLRIELARVSKEKAELKQKNDAQLAKWREEQRLKVEAKKAETKTNPEVKPANHAPNVVKLNGVTIVSVKGEKAKMVAENIKVTKFVKEARKNDREKKFSKPTETIKVENRNGRAPATIVSFEKTTEESSVTKQRFGKEPVDVLITTFHKKDVPAKKKVDYRGPEKLGYMLSPETFGALKRFQRTLPK